MFLQRTEKQFEFSVCQKADE